MNLLFKSKEFWLLYRQLENSNFGASKISGLAKHLSRDFVVSCSKDEDGETVLSVVFNFNCGDEYYLRLDLTVFEDGAEKFLCLIHKSSGQSFLLGWWDLASWHPYCLRLDELELLCSYWTKNKITPEEDIPFLLLNDFVGITEQKDLEKLYLRERVMYNKLGCYDDTIVSACYNPGKRSPEKKSDKYKWRKDKGLGWVFENKKFSCYSLRNKEHLGSNCGTFPFEQWEKMIRGINEQMR